MKRDTHCDRKQIADNWAKRMDKLLKYERFVYMTLCGSTGVQLKHVFTGKFVHISTTQTSRRDKNNMLVK